MMALYIFGAMGLAVAGLGIYIWKWEATHLLANFPKTPTKIRDKKGLARWAGIFSLILAALFVLEGYLVYKLEGTKYDSVPVLVGIPVTSFLVVAFMIGGQRFIEHDK